jgi:type IV secretion system protein VirB9
MHMRFAVSLGLLCLGSAATVIAGDGTLANDPAVTTLAAPAASLAGQSPAPPVNSAPNAPASSARLPSTAPQPEEPRVPAVIAPKRADTTTRTALPPRQLDSAGAFEWDAPVPLDGRTLEHAAQRWAHTGDAPVLVGTNGIVMYAYGESHPVVTCAPLRVCVIRLIAREHITNVAIGDSVRWLIASAQAGAGADATPVIIIKPTEADLVTNLAITSDAGRVYYLTLRSDPRRYVPQIGFYDPQQIVIRLSGEQAAAEAKAAARADTVVDDLGAVDPASLDFGFTCRAENRDAERWLPIRVFAGGGHTYVQMPNTLAYGDAPALFNLVGRGRHPQTELINSRLLHGYYVIDGLPSRFELLLGAGKAARTVSCAHD